jgi:hypothetical protein
LRAIGLRLGLRVTVGNLVDIVSRQATRSSGDKSNPAFATEL